MTTKAQIAAAAVAKAKAAENKKPVLAQDVFMQSLAPFFPDIAKETWLKSIYNTAAKFYGQGYSLAQLPDQVLDDKNAPTEFKTRFSGIQDLKKRQAAGENIAHIPTVAEYSVLSQQIKNQLNQYGLNSMASNDNVNKIIGSNVDFTQVQERLSGAFDAIDNADPYLKQELAKSYPNLNRSDLAMALLSGPEGAKALQKKVDIAGLRSAASEFGMQNSNSAEYLQSMGVTRADARAGYNKSQQEFAGLNEINHMTGGVGDLSQGLENANILGKESKQIQQLKSQARGQFSSGRFQAGAGSSERAGQL